MSKPKNTPPYSNWPVQDIFLSVFLAFATFAMLAISPVNLDVVLASSGEPALIGDNAWKRHLIAALAPLSSIAIKVLPMGFDFPETKRLFGKCLKAVTACVVVVWVVLVSQTFDSLSSGFDINNILQDSGGSNSTYVATQILMEILLGAVFFQAWSNLHAKHQPAKPDPNAAKLDEQIAEHEVLVAQACKSEEKALEEAESLRIQREVFMQKQIGALALLKSQPPFFK